MAAGGVAWLLRLQRRDSEAVTAVQQVSYVHTSIKASAGKRIHTRTGSNAGNWGTGMAAVPERYERLQPHTGSACHESGASAAGAER